MRFSPTRFVGSVIRNLLLAPCLLICLACATPFPIKNLEEGMTTETVREKFGEPVAANTVWDPPGGGNFLRGDWTYDAESSWTYVDEERNWVWSVFFSSVFLPVQIVESAIGAIIYSGDDDFRWDWAYVERKPVVLYFEQEELGSLNPQLSVMTLSFEPEKLVFFEPGKLARWEVIKPSYSQAWVGMEMDMDMQHHMMGHTHYHGH